MFEREINRRVYYAGHSWGFVAQKYALYYFVMKPVLLNMDTEPQTGTLNLNGLSEYLKMLAKTQISDKNVD